VVACRPAGVYYYYYYFIIININIILIIIIINIILGPTSNLVIIIIIIMNLKRSITIYFPNLGDTFFAFHEYPVLIYITAGSALVFGKYEQTCPKNTGNANNQKFVKS